MDMKGFWKGLAIGIGACCLLLAVLFIGISYIDKTGPLSRENAPETIRKAKAAAVIYFKKNYNVEVVATETGTSGEFQGSEVFLKGHVKGNKQLQFSATVDAYKGYQLEDIRLQRVEDIKSLSTTSFNGN